MGDDEMKRIFVVKKTGPPLTFFDYLVSVINCRSPKKSSFPAKAGIQRSQCFLDPPVKPEDDKIRLYGQTLLTAGIY
jgi:hypothetical protein